MALALQDFTIPALHVGDLSIEAHETEPATADFDIRFTLWHNESGGLTGRLLHDVSRFARPDAELLARQFTAVVGAAAAAPGTTVGHLPLLTAPARVSEADCEPTTLASMLRATAAAFPDRHAVTDGENTLTYRELDERSDASARRMSDEEGSVPRTSSRFHRHGRSSVWCNCGRWRRRGRRSAHTTTVPAWAVSHSWMLRRPSTRSPTSSRRPAPPAPPSRSP
ncbi:hypothetical protein GS498_17540 [Rhodococcus hoagii]|nr:hypothetical protein [Prescottella equi]